MTAPPQSLLLDATTDVVEGVAGQLDHVERIEHCDSVGKLVTDGVGVAAERIERGVLDGDLDVDALDTLVGEPVGVDPPRAALRGIE